MNNGDIDEFFAQCDLAEAVEKVSRPPNELWQLRAGPFPVLIQTQENVNRVRVVAFIESAENLGKADFERLLEANYHSALDARYALTDGHVVSLFLNPFYELSLLQFTMGFYQVLSCAASYGRAYSGGTLVFGDANAEGTGKAGSMEDNAGRCRTEIVRLIKGQGFG